MGRRGLKARAKYLADDAAAYEHIAVVVHRGDPEAQHICPIGRLLLCILAPLGSRTHFSKGFSNGVGREGGKRWGAGIAKHPSSPCSRWDG